MLYDSCRARLRLALGLPAPFAAGLAFGLPAPFAAEMGSAEVVSLLDFDADLDFAAKLVFLATMSFQLLVDYICCLFVCACCCVHVSRAAQA